jgi:multiple sugar transport system substrate-binding protein
MNYRRLGPYVSRGAVEMLTTHLADSSQIDAANYYPQALDGFTWQGDLACMPQNMSSPVIYYNKAIFDAAGLPYPHDDWTWDDFVATAKTLTQNFDRDGLIDIYGLGVEPSLVRAAPFIWMNGADIVDDPAAPTRLTLDSPASKEALAWFIALQTIHKVVPDAVAEESESSESRFLNGRLAMLMESRRASPEFRAIQAFDWDVAALPVGKERASILHSDAYCISAASKHKDAAWAFIEFANTDQGQSILAQTGRTVPSLRALAQSPVFIDPNARPANSQVFLEAIPSIRHLPLMTTWNDIEGVVDHELRSAYFGLITLDEAIETANRRSAEFFE